MSEYSPLPSTARSKLGRAESDEPCTRKSTGRDGSAGSGAPIRLRQRLRLISPVGVLFLAQYSALQIAPSSSPREPSFCAFAAAAMNAPAPSPAPLSSVRRATGCSLRNRIVMASSFCTAAE
jgi:hypothetical protein